MDSTPSITVFDGHNDTLLNLYLPERGRGRSFFEESDIGHIDLPRAIRGGFSGGFFAIFTPTPKLSLPANASKEEQVDHFLKSGLTPVDHDYALSYTLAITRLMYDLERESAGRIRVIRNIAELWNCLDDGALAMVFHIEGAEAIDPDLNALHVLYEAGLRSLGIVWSRPNAFGYGVPFSFPGSPDTGPGLTDVGKALVEACNELGVLIDLSHLNEKGFWDVAELTDKPLVATHSGVHAICPSPRNLTDQQIDAIRDSGGVMGINFHVGFLREDGERNADTPLSTLVKHVNYVIERIGIEHVALGSDFDGALMPNELGDVAGLPRLLDELRKSGHNDESLQRICSENWIHMLKVTWDD